MLVLRLAAGGRVAVRPADVAAAQASPWGAIIVLASDGQRFEVEHSIEQLGKMLSSLWLHGDSTIVNPELIVSIWEEGGQLHYQLEGGLRMTQTGVDIHQFLEAIEDARAQRATLHPPPGTA